MECVLLCVVVFCCELVCVVVCRCVSVCVLWCEMPDIWNDQITKRSSTCQVKKICWHVYGGAKKHRARTLHHKNRSGEVLKQDPLHVNVQRLRVEKSNYEERIAQRIGNCSMCEKMSSETLVFLRIQPRKNVVFVTKRTQRKLGRVCEANRGNIREADSSPCLNLRRALLKTGELSTKGGRQQIHFQATPHNKRMLIRIRMQLVCVYYVVCDWYNKKQSARIAPE